MGKWSFQRIRKLMPQIALRGMAGNELGRALISMMARSTKGSNQRPDTLMQDRTSANSMKVLLQRTAGPYIWVNRVISAIPGVSGSPQERTVGQCPRL